MFLKNLTSKITPPTHTAPAVLHRYQASAVQVTCIRNRLANNHGIHKKCRVMKRNPSIQIPIGVENDSRAFSNTQPKYSAPQE